MSRGFTLLELLLSIILFSVIALAAFLLYDTNARLQDQAEGAAARVTSAQSAMRAIERDLRGSWVASDLADQKAKLIFMALDGESDEDADDTLDFISSTSALGATLGGDLVRVQYYIERDEENPEKSRLIRVSRPLMAEREGGTNRLPAGEAATEVASGVVGFDLQSATSSQYKAEWDSTRDGKWPDIVRVTVTTIAREGGKLKTSTYSTKVALRLIRDMAAAAAATGSTGS